MVRTQPLEDLTYSYQELMTLVNLRSKRTASYREKKYFASAFYAEDNSK